MPKKHVHYFYELDEQTANSIMHAAQMISLAIKQLYSPDGITVCQNGGSFDELTHFHMHVIPKYKGENFADFYTEEEEISNKKSIDLALVKNQMAKFINSDQIKEQ